LNQLQQSAEYIQSAKHASLTYQLEAPAQIMAIKTTKLGGSASGIQVSKTGVSYLLELGGNTYIDKYYSMA
jgi:hypothetical protein